MISSFKKVKFRLVVVLEHGKLQRSHLGEFDIGVHATNACAFCFLEEDEALVAPVLAPQILDLPIIVVAI